ncbi:MAG: sigma-70 family RNA polymerase sigma factor [Bifidobacteriaceae bacterium]|nr:sigma-70 family RNA polymerase sigma factor [Bifidobacteriaceae bacterium]
MRRGRNNADSDDAERTPGVGAPNPTPPVQAHHAGPTSSLPNPGAAAIEAFCALYQDNHARIVAYAARRLGSADLAEDCAAEVFRIAWEHAAREPGTAGGIGPGWLFATARNLIAHQWRAAGRATTLARVLAVELDRAEPPGGGAGLNERLVDALESLPAEQRELLIARYWDGLSADETAALFDLSPGAVRVRWHRARAALKRLLEQPKERS